MSQFPKTTRRQFLATSTLLATSVALNAQPAPPATKPSSKPAPEKLDPVPVITPVPGPAFLHAGPMVGHVTDRTTRLWAKGSNQGRLAFKIGQQPDLSDGRVIDAPAMAEESSFTGQVEVDGLTAATRYYYARDRDHDWSRQALGKLSPPLITCEAVMSETLFLLRAAKNRRAV